MRISDKAHIIVRSGSGAVTTRCSSLIAGRPLLLSALKPLQSVPATFKHGLHQAA